MKTISDLKSVLPSTKGRGLPRPETLLKNPPEIFLQEEHLTIFKNGLYLYGYDGHYTVNGVDRCGSSVYVFAASADEVEEAMKAQERGEEKDPDIESHFIKKNDGYIKVVKVKDTIWKDCDFRIPLSLDAELRLRHNADSRQDSKIDFHIEGASEADYEAALRNKADDAALKKVGHEQLEKAISLLSDKQREVIHMKYYENKDTAEMADILGIDERSVRYRIDGALKKLKRILK